MGKDRICHREHECQQYLVAFMYESHFVKCSDLGMLGPGQKHQFFNHSRLIYLPSWNLHCTQELQLEVKDLLQSLTGLRDVVWPIPNSVSRKLAHWCWSLRSHDHASCQLYMTQHKNGELTRIFIFVQWSVGPAAFLTASYRDQKLILKQMSKNKHVRGQLSDAY